MSRYIDNIILCELDKKKRILYELHIKNTYECLDSFVLQFKKNSLFFKRVIFKIYPELQHIHLMRHDFVGITRSLMELMGVYFSFKVFIFLF